TFSGRLVAYYVGRLPRRPPGYRRRRRGHGAVPYVARTIFGIYMPKQERIRLKHVVSVSLGASSRDHAVEIDIFGERVRIERRGTDGSVEKAIKLIRELDGNVDAMGMGGIDLYIAAGKRRYTLRAALPLARAARRTPIVDGSGLKNTLERRVVRYLQHHGPM